MAKKKRNKSKDADKAESSASTSSSSPPSTSASATASQPVPKTAIDIAYRAGNYAAVAQMANNDSSAHAQDLKRLINVDRGQLIVGAIALAVVTTVALFTLH